MIYFKNVLAVFFFNNLACPWNASDPANQTYYDDYYRRCTLGMLLIIIYFIVCPANPSYFADTVNKICVKYCPIGKYALDTNRSCTSNCPSYYFINDTLSNT